MKARMPATISRMKMSTTNRKYCEMCIKKQNKTMKLTVCTDKHYTNKLHFLAIMWLEKCTFSPSSFEAMNKIAWWCILQWKHSSETDSLAQCCWILHFKCLTAHTHCQQHALVFHDGATASKEANHQDNDPCRYTQGCDAEEMEAWHHCPIAALGYM